MKSSREQIGSGLKVEFKQDARYLETLTTQVIDKARANPKSVAETVVNQADLQALVSINLTPSNCKSDSEMADLMIACLHPSEKVTTVVMFMRGLCDSCKFEPIVVRKK
jgi:acyl-CoA synthetase (NDP forming)